MRWSDERYVRAYVRDTTEWCLLSWQARALFLELLRKVDLSGFIAVGKAGVRGLALVVRMPADVVELALRAEDGLLADGCLVEVDGGLMMPNYVEAQSARSSDKQRKQEQRSRDAAARLQSGRIVTDGDETGRAVTPGDQTGQPVTNRDSASQNVTDSHTPSPAVTDGHSVLSCTEPYRAKEEDRAQGAPNLELAVEVPSSKHVEASPQVQEVWNAYVEGWQAHVGRGAKPVLSDARKRLIKARLKEHPVDVVSRAAAGIWASPWHREQGQTSLDLAMRSTANVERFSGDPPKPSPSNFRGPVRSVQPSTSRTTMSLDEYVNSPANHQGDF